MSGICSRHPHHDPTCRYCTRIPSTPGQTHYEGCERTAGHHGCALAKLDALRDAAQSLLMLLDEWAWTAHRLTQSPGVKATVAQDDMIRRRNELWALVAAARAQP